MAAWGRSPASGRMLLLPACMAPRPLQLRLGKLLWVCRFAARRRSYKWTASPLNAYIALAPSANVQPRVARMKSGGRCRQSYPQCQAQVSRLPARANARLLATAERTLWRGQCHGRLVRGVSRDQRGYSGGSALLSCGAVLGSCAAGRLRIAFHSSSPCHCWPTSLYSAPLRPSRASDSGT